MHFYRLKHEQKLRRARTKDEYIDSFSGRKKDQRAETAEPKVLQMHLSHRTHVSKAMLKPHHKQVCIFAGLQAWFLAILFESQISSNLCFED